MDAGLFEVLHDAADVQLGAVVQRVDVDLDRVVEEAVDQQRHARPDDDLAGGAHEVVAQARGVVDDLHAAAAEHEARAHEHGVADVLGDGDGARRRRSPCRGAGATRPAASRMSLNSWRSSARSIASGLVPRMR